MKRVLFTIAAAGALMTAAPALAQAGWTGIDTRQAQLDARIEQGARSGALTPNEAARLRAEFRDIAIIEARYKANGLNDAERADLNRRFDDLSARVRMERADNQGRDGRGGFNNQGRDGRGDFNNQGRGGQGGFQGDRGGWETINARQARLDQRIDQGMRNGSLTRNEAMRLRVEFRALADMEARYRQSDGGLQNWERADLDRRFDALSARIRMERADNQGRPGAPGAWISINARQAALDRRIERGVRDGSLNRNEAERLRMEFRSIAQAEAVYRRDGRLERREEAELDRRFDLLAARIRLERNDWQRVGQGYGR